MDVLSKNQQKTTDDDDDDEVHVSVSKTIQSVPDENTALLSYRLLHSVYVGAGRSLVADFIYT